MTLRFYLQFCTKVLNYCEMEILLEDLADLELLIEYLLKSLSSESLWFPPYLPFLAFYSESF
jgi:hypothetical protein